MLSLRSILREADTTLGCHRDSPRKILPDYRPSG